MVKRNFVWGCVLWLICSCGASDKAPGSGPPDANGNPPTGTPDDSAGFYVRPMATGKADFPSHGGLATFDVACQADSGEFLDCYVEGEENDLYFQGMQLQYNVPRTLCDYFEYMPYYYWGKQSGAGPAQVRIDVGADGSQGLDNNNDGTIDAAATTKCVYDYTPDGPNCCTGTYTQINRTWNATSSSYDTTFNPNVSWGGRAADCLTGPAMDTQGKTRDGFPKSTMLYVDGTGVNDVYKINSPISKDKGTNLHIANYFDPADHGGSTPTAVVNPYYDFKCLDRAHDMKAQIRVQIRDWDTEAGFDARVTSPNGHSVAGDEVWPISGLPLNDFFDWKNIGNAYPNDL